MRPARSYRCWMFVSDTKQLFWRRSWHRADDTCSTDIRSLYHGDRKSNTGCRSCDSRYAAAWCDGVSQSDRSSGFRRFQPAAGQSAVGNVTAFGTFVQLLWIYLPASGTEISARRNSSSIYRNKSVDSECNGNCSRWRGHELHEADRICPDPAGIAAL